MPKYFCHDCSKETEHINVCKAAKIAQVARSTIYRWIEKDWVHYLMHPSDRIFICVESLLRRRKKGRSAAGN
jgi:predicted site-specific integrase-resolvase